MTGRYALAKDVTTFAKKLSTNSSYVFKARYNIAPYQAIPAIEQTTKQFNFYYWGLIPAWQKEINKENSLYNYPAEELLSKKPLIQLWRHKRLLIPATGFYVWKLIGNKKQPFYISMKDDSVFAIAGIYDKAVMSDGEGLSALMLTTLADKNSSIAKLTNRLPVIVRENYYDLIMANKKIKDEDFEKIVQPFSESFLKVTPVSVQVNNPDNDSAACHLALD